MMREDELGNIFGQEETAKSAIEAAEKLEEMLKEENVHSVNVRKMIEQAEELVEDTETNPTGSIK